MPTLCKENQTGEAAITDALPSWPAHGPDGPGSSSAAEAVAWYGRAALGQFVQRAQVGDGWPFVLTTGPGARALVRSCGGDSCAAYLLAFIHVTDCSHDTTLRPSIGVEFLP